MHTAQSPQGWLASRALEPRWSPLASGLVNLVIILLATWGCWWLFFSTKGVCQLYTPLLGFSLVIWLLLITVWQTEIFDFWPFSRGFLGQANPLVKGGALTAVMLGVYAVFILGLFFYLIGQYGITYFNWHSLTAHGKLGTDVLTARETASWAYIALSVPFFWFSVVVALGLGRDLWPGLSQPRLGLANWLFVAVLSLPAFFLLFHPHIGSMFYPAQVYTAVPPWWKDLAQTNSSEFSLGIVFDSVIMIFLTMHLWRGRPWNLVSRQPWRLIFLAAGSLVLGIILFKVQLAVMDYLWDEAYIGGQNESNFGWRYSHTVTMGAFLVVPAMVLNQHFGALLARLGTLAAGLLGSVLAVGLGLGFAWLYYEFGPALLGVCEGVSHPSENAAAFLIMIMVLLNIQDSFMDGWPGYRLRK
ncbi:MAG: hypothetical protein V1797_07730 [Pseudomonadota bacterium]